MLLFILKVILLFLIPIVIPVVLLVIRRTRRYGIAFLAIYVLAYVVLSSRGGYVARDLGGGMGSAGVQGTEIAYY